MNSVSLDADNLSFVELSTKIRKFLSDSSIEQVKVHLEQQPILVVNQNGNSHWFFLESDLEKTINEIFMDNFSEIENLLKKRKTTAAFLLIAKQLHSKFGAFDFKKTKEIIWKILEEMVNDR